MEFKLGETYSGYRFLDVLKRSRNGIEYWVQNTCAQRLEVLRMLPQGAQNDREQIERFLREMRVRAQLVHPNIVTLFSAFELERQLVMTTELVEGTTLAERLTLGPLPLAEATGLIRQALGAVGFAHQQRVVHRDINPEDMVITYEGVLKLNNFALAKSAASPRLTQVGTVIGNLKYIAPEQIKGMVEADGRSDLYSLGIVFYEMLCGRVPFDSPSQFEVMAAHVSEPPKLPSSLNPAIPKELDPVVLKALAKDPAERYQTAQEFDQAILQATAALDQQAAAAQCAGASAPPVEAPADAAAEQPAAVAAAAAATRPAAPAASQPVMRAPEPLEAEAPVPQEASRTVEFAPSPAAPAPLFLAAPNAPVTASPLLLYSGAAAVCVGLVVTVLWLVGR